MQICYRRPEMVGSWLSHHRQLLDGVHTLFCVFLILTKWPLMQYHCIFYY
uniref:Uncharacterized protein n=1 Tax=Anguilla anguilla TaxID=7936 RepID=A0A0E9QHJ4_ANGAN